MANELYEEVTQKVKLLKVDPLEVEGGVIFISLSTDADVYGDYYLIEIDGVKWVDTRNQTHAIVLYKMMKDHITEYMHYKKI